MYENLQAMDSMVCIWSLNLVHTETFNNRLLRMILEKVAKLYIIKIVLIISPI